MKRSIFLLLICLLAAIPAHAYQCTGLPTGTLTIGASQSFAAWPSGFGPFQAGTNAVVPGGMISSTSTCCGEAGAQNTLALLEDGVSIRTAIPITPDSCAGTAWSCSYTKYNYSVQACDIVPPPHCANGSLDYDETGIDCGGPTCGACQARCPSNTCPAYDAAEQDIVGCFSVVFPDAYGNCPQGYEPTQVISTPAGSPCHDLFNLNKSICTYSTYPTNAAPTATIPPAESPEGWGGSVSTVPADPSKPSGESSTTTTTPAGGGTPTTTGETTTTKNPDGSVTTTTKNPDGSTTTTTKKPATEDNPDNYNYNPSVNLTDDTKLDGLIKPGDFGSGPDWNTLKTSIDAQISEVQTALSTSGLTLANPSCASSVELYGHTIKISLCEYYDILSNAGTILVALTYITGLLYLWDRS